MRASLLSVRHKLELFFRLLGKRAALWALIACLSSVILVGVELLIATGIQALLATIGAISMPSISVGGMSFSFFSDFTRVSLFLVVVAFLRSLFQLLQSYGNFMIRECTLYRLRRSLLSRLLNPAGVFVPTAEVQTSLSEIFPKASVCAYYVVNAFVMTIQTLALGVALALISFNDFWIASIGVLVVGVINKRTSFVLRRLSGTMPKAQLKLNEGLSRIARNWLFLRIMRGQEVEKVRLQQEIDRYQQASEKGVYWSNLNGAFTPFLGVVLIVVIVFCNQRYWPSQSALLVPFLYMLVRFIGALSSVVNAFSAIHLNSPQLSVAVAQLSKADVKPTVKIESQFKSEAAHQDQIVTPPRIAFQNLSFTYPGSETPLFRDLNLQLAEGGQLGILGPSGVGKTTLLYLILGILRPTKGDISIASIPAQDAYSSRGLNIGYVGPDPMLIEGTIKQNLHYGSSRTFSDQEIWSALEKVKLRSLIESLPNQLDTHLNEHADTLSAGQKQRLSLARALIGNPSLLVLDEVSANLDDKTEGEITESLLQLKGKCTTVIVSHRDGILKYTDQVLNLGTIYK